MSNHYQGKIKKWLWLQEDCTLLTGAFKLYHFLELIPLAFRLAWVWKHRSPSVCLSGYMIEKTYLVSGMLIISFSLLTICHITTCTVILCDIISCRFIMHIIFANMVVCHCLSHYQVFLIFRVLVWQFSHLWSCHTLTFICSSHERRGCMPHYQDWIIPTQHQWA